MSLITNHNIDSGIDYVKLQETYVVFICLEDVMNVSKYKCEFVYLDKNTNLPLGDGKAEGIKLGTAKV